MIEDIKLSEKEIFIFNGIINLMKEGANPYSIKVSDIAIASNVGKGTIYDYFDSKEEAISKAIIYNINNEIIDGFTRINSKESFKDKFYEILQIIVDNWENNLSTFNILLSTGGIQEFYEYIIDDKYDLSKCMSIFNSVMDELLELGVKEEIINTVETKYYQIMAMQSAISGFSHYISKRNLYENISIEEAKDTAYKIFIKALN